MLPSTIAAALLIGIDTNDSEYEIDSENESNNSFHHEDIDSELSIPPTDMDTIDTSTIDSSNETDELELSTAADDDSSIIDIDADDDNLDNIDHIDSDESNEESVQPAKRFKPDDTVENESDSVDPSQKCPICLGAWTPVGDHRLCSLRCGHLFGYKCIEQWLNSGNQSSKRCPQCNTKASVRHIRFLYANKLTCLDNSELEKVKKQFEEANKRYRKLSKALNKQKKRTQKYKKMYKARSLSMTVDSDFCFSD